MSDAMGLIEAAELHPSGLTWGQLRAASEKVAGKKMSAASAARDIRALESMLSQDMWQTDLALVVDSHRHQNKRRLALRKATPPWADEQKIKRLYLKAQGMTQRTGQSHVVDHVIPIQHPLVCGLHTHRNMRVITHAANAKKHNIWHRG